MADENKNPDVIEDARIFRPLCVYCVHHVLNANVHMCIRLWKTRINLVTGDTTVDGGNRRCGAERMEGWLFARLMGKCGKEGRFFVSNGK